MTAGRGILHQEMPRGDASGRMHGFQLWANLPAALKMTAPRYQEIAAADIPELVDDDGTRVRIVCGEFWGKRGPVEGIAADPVYLDVDVPAGRRRRLPVALEASAFAYVFAGEGRFGGASAPQAMPTENAAGVDGPDPGLSAANRALVLFDRGDEVVVTAGAEGLRFLLVSGRPLREPVAWRGPIVMNSDQELREAYAQLDRGTFLEV